MSPKGIITITMLPKGQKYFMPSLHASISPKLLVSHLYNDSLTVLCHDMLSTQSLVFFKCIFILFIYFKELLTCKPNTVSETSPQERGVCILGSFVAFFPLQRSGYTLATCFIHTPTLVL